MKKKWLQPQRRKSVKKKQYKRTSVLSNRFHALLNKSVVCHDLWTHLALQHLQQTCAGLMPRWSCWRFAFRAFSLQKKPSVNATLSSPSFNLWGPHQWLIADLLCGAATMPGFRLRWQTAEVCANLWAHNSSWTVEGSLSAVSALEPRALRIDVPSPIHT